MGLRGWHLILSMGLALRCVCRPCVFKKKVWSVKLMYAVSAKYVSLPDMSDVCLTFTMQFYNGLFSLSDKCLTFHYRILHTLDVWHNFKLLVSWERQTVVTICLLFTSRDCLHSSLVSWARAPESFHGIYMTCGITEATMSWKYWIDQGSFCVCKP